MIGRRIAQQDKAGIILVLTAACFGLTYFFHHELGSGRLVTHFYYVPSILAVIWWGWRALPVSLILAGFLVFSSNWFRIDPVSANDTIRAVLFLFIVSTVAMLSDGIRRARDELHESEKRYKAVFDNLNLGVAFYRVEDNGRRIVLQELNHAAQAIDQIESDQVVGKDLASVFPGAEEFGICESIRRVWESGVPEHNGVRFYRDQRISGWRENFAFRLPGGEVVSVYKDKTAEKLFEEKVRQLASIVESSHDAIIGVGLDGTVVSWNHAAEMSYGYTAAEMLGRSVLDIIPPELHGQTLSNLQIISANRSVEPFESYRIRKDSSNLDVSVSMSPVLDINGKVAGASLIAHDITSRKEMEAALRKAHDHLEQRVRQRTRELAVANEELSDQIRQREQVEEDLRKSNEQVKLFSYRVLHDLKSPTIRISGLTRLLQKKYGGILDEKGRKFCEQINRGAEQIASLVEKVNQFIATREVSVAFEDIAVRELFQSVGEEFASRLAERRVSLQEEESRAVIRGDWLALMRVLRNFVENALKYGGDSLSSIRLGYKATEAYHVLSVSDNGLGVRSENRQRIFNLFERDRSSSIADGSGLGLSIAKDVAEQHQGSVWLESTPLVETTFYISIFRNLRGAP